MWRRVIMVPSRSSVWKRQCLPSSELSSIQPSTTCLGQIRTMAGGWDQRGYDLTADSLMSSQDRPKVVLEGYSPSGFAVNQVVKNMTDKYDGSGSIHMHGSIVAFPHACFLWNVKKASDITVESLAPIALHQPKINILIIGCNDHIPQRDLSRIMAEMMDLYGIAVEKVKVYNAMGTFNFLNAEDRDVAVAILLDDSGAKEAKEAS